MSDEARARLNKAFFRPAMIIGVEYSAVMVLVLSHYLKTSFRLYGEAGELPSSFFEMIAIAFIGLGSLVFYLLGIWAVRSRISRRLRIGSVIALQFPVLSTALLLAIVFWIELASLEAVAAACVASMIVLQAPVLISRLLDTR
jgi:magnesium-transporting ATPase (P-type)